MSVDDNMYMLPNPVGLSSLANEVIALQLAICKALHMN